MTPAIAQTLLALIAGMALFLLWRRIASSGRTTGWIVTAGFLARAAGGLGAFWISYLRLPIARSLQLGNGLWVFALDGSSYFDAAVLAARGGPAAIVYLNKTTPSVFYVQTLATTLLLFGSVVSAAILVNLFAYLLCCGAILRLGDARSLPVRLAIAAVSLSPSAVMWALQPLKDTVFVFLVTLFFAASAAWQRFSSRGTAAARETVMATAVLVATIYAISGIRWYFGMLLAIASVVFILLSVIRADRRGAVAAAGAALLPLLTAAVFIGSGPYLPDPIRLVLLGRLQPARAGGQIVESLNRSHQAFNNSHANTTIEAGTAIRHIDRSLGAHEERVELSAAAVRAMPGSTDGEEAAESGGKSAPDQNVEKARKASAEPAPAISEASDAESIPMTSASKFSPPIAAPQQLNHEAQAARASDGETTPAEPSPASGMQPANVASQSEDSAPDQPKNSPAAARQLRRPANPQSSSRALVAETNAPAAPESHTAGSASSQQRSSSGPSSPPSGQAAALDGGAQKTPSKPAAGPATPSSSRATALQRRMRPNRATRRTAAKPAVAPASPVVAQEPRNQPVAEPSTAPQPVTGLAAPSPARATAAVHTPSSAPAETVTVASSPLARLLAGTAAMVLPRQLASALGVVNIHGGHGLWFIVEVDTLAFDAVLLFALVSIVSALRRPRFVAPVFWMILIVTGAIAGILVYTVSNFGTLFRHREMILLGLELLPIAAMQASGSAAEMVRADGAARPG